VAERFDLSHARVLVTGGAGFIGSNFVHHFLRRFPGSHVVVLDALTYAGRQENLRDLRTESCTFIRGDICKFEDVMGAMAGCDYVLNFAAQSHVDRSLEEPGQFIYTDVFGVYVLCEVARQIGVKRFVQISTDEVYGEVLEGVATEKWPVQPRSPYSASKAGGEHIALASWASWGLPVVITRSSNNYGPFQYPEKLIPLFVTNAIDDQTLPVYGSGRNRRDWLHVSDQCDALIALLAQPGIEGDIFNIGAGNELDVLEITDLILSLLGKPTSLICHVEDRPGHDRRYALNSLKIQKLTGWEPQIPFMKGIEQTVAWYQENEAWWRPIKAGEFRAYYERMYGQRRVLKEVRA
jgi:dTDP-glucose 4,6-dehydratase